MKKSSVKWLAKEQLPLGSESSNLTKQITPPLVHHQHHLSLVSLLPDMLG